MSIIYDALKKIELKLKKPAEQAAATPAIKKSGFNFKYALVYVLVIILGYFGMRFFYNLITPPATPAKGLAGAQRPVQQAATPPQVQQPSAAVVATPAPAGAPAPAIVEEPREEPAPPLPAVTLNGIMSSGDDGYALINNRIVQVGDDVGGYIVSKIEQSAVELKAKDRVVRIPLDF